MTESLVVCSFLDGVKDSLLNIVLGTYLKVKLLP